jgi:tRNA threonylcarbamoyladenosine modification (KEOPS) complex  Pcc1 subunit
MAIVELSTGLAALNDAESGVIRLLDIAANVTGFLCGVDSEGSDPNYLKSCVDEYLRLVEVSLKL